MASACISVFSTAPSSAEFVVVTVLSIRGSAPRHAGACMVVGSDGRFVGTVGGGQGERAALAAASEAFGTRRSAVLRVEMLGAQAKGADMICGGVASLFVEYVAGERMRVYKAAAERLAGGMRTLIVRILGPEREDGATDAAVSAYSANGDLVAGPPLSAAVLARFPRESASSSFFAEAERAFFQIEDPDEKLLILGGGHVGTALARAALPLSFAVTVADERPEFAEPSRYPAGVRSACGSYPDIIAAFPFDQSTYAVIVTPGHLRDLDCVRAVLAREFKYVGLIGSARKTAMLRDQLRADGVPEESIGRLRSPIGLDIGAETPEEIAVSIAAELISFRRGGARRSSS